MFEQFLVCSGCGEPNLHHHRVEVFERPVEDAETGVHVVVEGCKATVDLPLEGNPSSRRNGVKIYLNCESCEEITILEILQHKGATYVNQGVAALTRKSIIVPDENPDITLWEAIQAAERAWRAQNYRRDMGVIEAGEHAGAGRK